MRMSSGPSRSSDGRQHQQVGDLGRQVPGVALVVAGQALAEGGDEGRGQGSARHQGEEQIGQAKGGEIGV